MKLAFAALSVCLLSVTAAEAKTLCTVVADARTGELLEENGVCRTRVTPASTFKIPLAVMGYDAGFLSDITTPAIPFKEGYADWGGPEWQQTTDPTRWMKYSVVWYSQRITEALGVATLENYAAKFGYGNADFAGDPGKNNALERAWISSSLKISPVEQVAFLRNLVNRTLPVSTDAMDMTAAVLESSSTPNGWTVTGKTGSAFPRLADGTFDRAKGWGWFVGWAEKDGRTLVFARLNQDEQRHTVGGGVRARDELLEGWDMMVDALPAEAL
ncbi:class D beta-lactamase [Devosia sp. Leaf64]|uniref:class D beta-lactamase n=1 Tax=Devosia sp. Leaf64 TaxID=1736229 RepID=UPI000715693E|nr:class D beta-lactamase [Devosia sp. Leaf64]KQN74413.1 class D beta-lactamase [Devosia sp. Leaf64]